MDDFGRISILFVGALIFLALTAYWWSAAERCAARGGVLVRSPFVGWECVREARR